MLTQLYCASARGIAKGSFRLNYSCLRSEPAGTRTQDPLIKSQVLYRLSYGLRACLCVYGACFGWSILGSRGRPLDKYLLPPDASLKPPERAHQPGPTALSQGNGLGRSTVVIGGREAPGAINFRSHDQCG